MFRKPLHFSTPSPTASAMNQQTPSSSAAEDKGLALIAVSATTLVIGVVLVALRIYVRTKSLKNIWWYELFVVIALVRGRPSHNL